MPAKRNRQAMRVKVYRNPPTGEIVESKGGTIGFLVLGRRSLAIRKLSLGCSSLSHLMRFRIVHLYSMGQGATLPVGFTGLRPGVFLSPTL